MAAPDLGFTRIEENRRFEDLRSAKQHFTNRHVTEYIMGGTGATGAGIEMSWTSDDLDYPAAEDQVYIRTEANDDPAQVGKYVYIEYCDDDGLILGPLGAVHSADTTDEKIITGASDFFRLRRMWAEVESDAAGGKAHQLTDADLDAATHYAFIEDGESSWAAERYFVPSATQVEHSYLAKLEIIFPLMTAAATAVDAVILALNYTPKVIPGPYGGATPQVAADKTLTMAINSNLDWQPMIELEPATEIKFVWSDTTTAQTIKWEATFLEVWVKTNPTT